ncbi:hypothetical protein TNCT_21351 [Trichonephila clavata]|uniref:Uncharacterized protein n=1 Tax=Trichonephila clavata TaxID=2740835 RepID=A0A8X6LWS0_TRICU|nr:hypothetical protein TNCT_21351 [Trichonephila clavata]
MYKNALKEDFIRVVEELDGTVESIDTVAKLKTKIEKSSTFESDADFVKTLKTIFSSGLHEKNQVPLRTAYGQAGRCGIRDRGVVIRLNLSKIEKQAFFTRRRS